MTPCRAPRVLVVAYNFPPHAAIGTMRTLRVVRRLAETGWDVTVLTSDPATFQAQAPSDAALLARVPPSVKVVRAGVIRRWDRSFRLAAELLRPAPASSGGAGVTTSGPRPSTSRSRGPVAGLAAIKDVVDAALSIPDRECGWLLPALSRGVMDRLRSFPPDVIYSSAPPWTGQLVAAGLRALVRRPWVADFRDPWARAPWRGDRYRFAMRAAGTLERYVVRHADRLIFVAQGNRDDFAAFYGPAVASKFEVVANGCDPDEFDVLERPKPNGDGSFVMLHAGSLYGGRTPEPLLRALVTAIDRGLIDRRRFRLRFLGFNGLQSADLPGVCRQLGLEDLVEFVGRVPREESLRAMVSASSLLLLQPGHSVSVPGKLYQYFAAGRPVFAIAEGETAQLVRASGLGISAAPDDQGAMVEGLAAIVRLGSGPVQPPPRELFDGHVGAARIEQTLRAVAMVGSAVGSEALRDEHHESGVARKP